MKNCSLAAWSRMVFSCNEFQVAFDGEPIRVVTCMSLGSNFFPVTWLISVVPIFFKGLFKVFCKACSEVNAAFMMQSFKRIWEYFGFQSIFLLAPFRALLSLASKSFLFRSFRNETVLFSVRG